MKIFDELNKEQEKLNPASKTTDITEQAVLISGVFVDKMPEAYIFDVVNILRLFTMIDFCTHEGIKRIDSQSLHSIFKNQRMHNDWMKLRFSCQKIQEYDKKIIFCFNTDVSVAEYLKSKKFHICMFSEENFLKELEEYVRPTTT